MADLPKFVRERLKAAPVEAHPDADLLAAFAERRLGERERAQVLAHLAACAACREVVSLALPQEEEEAAAAAPHPARWWAVRWQTAAALATVAVAGVILLMIPNAAFHPGRSTMPQVAHAPVTPEGRTATREGSNAPAAETATVSAKPETKTGPAEAAAKKPAAAREAGAAGKVSEELAKVDTGKDKMVRPIPAPAQKQDQVSALAPPPASAAPQKQAYDFGGAQATDRSTEQAAGAPRSTVGGLVTGQGAGQAAKEEVRKAPAEQQTPARIPSTAETVEVQAEAAPVTTAQWRTTPSGTVERLSDDGQTWRPVKVASGAVLNAVSAVGDSVWAGGHQQHLAVLYYSADSGAHWARLDFAGPAGAHPVDVVALGFTDTQHGVMAVVAAEDPQLRQIWTTADGGHTWSAPAH